MQLRLNPESESLRRSCLVLADELARLLADREVLLGVVGPDLEAEYRVAVGDLQLELLAQECAVRRLRRKLELLRAALNQGTRPDERKVEATLDAEFAVWQAQLERERAAVRVAGARLAAPRLGPKESVELRSVFRRLARRCHPDANPLAGPAEAALWTRASQAYAAGDLDELRALELLADAAPELPASSAVGELRARCDALRAAVERLLAELAAMRERFPFHLQASLQDPEWIAGRRAEIAVRRDTLADQRQWLEAALTQIQAEEQSRGD